MFYVALAAPPLSTAGPVGAQRGDLDVRPQVSTRAPFNIAEECSTDALWVFVYQSGGAQGLPTHVKKALQTACSSLQ
eukprot:9027248-Alexandrium_andersonii.AAC.1